jgi:hypothetical protein
MRLRRVLLRKPHVAGNLAAAAAAAVAPAPLHGGVLHGLAGSCELLALLPGLVNLLLLPFIYPHLPSSTLICLPNGTESNQKFNRKQSEIQTEIHEFRFGTESKQKAIRNSGLSNRNS